MPPVIEFNEKAKPKLAKAFGGELQVDHCYLLRGGQIIKMIKAGEGECPPTWMKGMFISGGDEGCVGWWYKDGLYQGREFSSSCPNHVEKEVDKPTNLSPVMGTGLVLKSGGVYKTKLGSHTQPMTLHQLFDGQVNGPVFKTRLMDKEQPTLTATGVVYYNQKGGYLGIYTDSLKWQAASPRNLVAEVVPEAEEKILTKAQAKQLWMNGVKLMYKDAAATMPWCPFPKNGPDLYTENWFDLLNHLTFKVA